MNFFERRRFLKKANLLDLTPVRLHEYEEEDTGKVVILVKNLKMTGLRILPLEDVRRSSG